MKIGTRAPECPATSGLILFGSTIAAASTITQLTVPFSADTGTWDGVTPLGTAGGGPAYPHNQVDNGASILTTNGNQVFVSFSADTSPGIKPGAIGIIGTDFTNWGSPGQTSGTLLTTEDFGNGADTLTLTFTHPVQSFGVYIQDVTTGHPFTVQFSATDTSSSSSLQFTQGSATNPVFIGVTDATFDIKTVTMDVTAGDSLHFFEIGNISLLDSGPLGPSTGPSTGGPSTGGPSTGPSTGGPSTGGTPEPGSVFLMATGLAGLIWKMRKSRTV